MNDPQQGARASLTQSVREFRRAARLAAADPLRLLPPDPLARLATMSAMVTALIDATPFERLRDAVAAPATTRRRNGLRTRLQPVAPTKPAADTASPLHHVAAGNPEPTPARLPSPSDPLGRGAAAMATLAERRAALRRGRTDPDSRSRPAAPPLERAEARASSSSRPSHAPGIGLSDAGRNSRLLVDRDDAPAPTSALLAGQEMRRPGHEPWLTDGQENVPQHRNDPPARAAFAPVEMPLVDETLHPAARGERETAAASERRPLHIPGLTPSVAPPTMQADANAVSRRRAPDPAIEPELADALFEALYREGVDVSWP